MKRVKVWSCQLRAARLARGLTLRGVEEATGVNIATVWAAERGYDVLLSNAVVLAEFFGTPVHELWAARPIPVAHVGKPP